MDSSDESSLDTFSSESSSLNSFNPRFRIDSTTASNLDNRSLNSLNSSNSTITNDSIDSYIHDINNLADLSELPAGYFEGRLRYRTSNLPPPRVVEFDDEEPNYGLDPITEAERVERARLQYMANTNQVPLYVDSFRPDHLPPQYRYIHQNPVIEESNTQRMFREENNFYRERQDYNSEKIAKANEVVGLRMAIRPLALILFGFLILCLIVIFIIVIVTGVSLPKEKDILNWESKHKKK